MDNLKGHAANILADKFKEIASSTVSSDSGTNAQRLQKILGDSFTSPNVLPLGYQSSTPPNDKSRCDMPGCLYFDIEDLPWKIIRGCSHSFHLICLKGRKYCPLCKIHLAKEVQRLGNIAKEAIFSTNNATTDETDQCGDEDDQSDVDIDDNDRRSGFDPRKLDELKSLRPNVPGLVRPSQVSQQVHIPKEKPSHCKKCMHVVKGHKRPRNEAVRCPLCPSGICREGGGQIVCTCEWHLPMPLSTENHPANPVLISVEDNITVYSFRYSQSQATLSPSQISNACTPISLLVCCAVYKETIPDLSVTNLNDIQNFFVDKLTQGNAIYNIIDQPLHQPNLQVDEVLEKISMPAKVGPAGFVGVTDLPQLKQEVQNMFHSKEKMCAVMITPPDKSFAICKRNGKIILFDSHHHFQRGAVIAFSEADKTDDMCDYIYKMIVNDWNQRIQFSNLTPIIPDDN